MRQASILLAAALVSVGAISLSWPSRVAAEEQQASTKDEAKKSGAHVTHRTGAKAIREELAKKTDFELKGVPLNEAMDYLADKHGIQIQLDAAPLRDAGIDPTTTQVTLSTKDGSLKSALKLILSPFNLTYVLQDELLLVTTSDKANLALQAEVYDVGDVLLRDEKDQPDFDSLINLLETVIAPQTWNEQGGPGTIKRGPLNTLIVSQTEENQEGVQWLLGDIRKVHDRVKAGNYDSSLAAFDSPKEEAIRKALEGKATLDFQGVSLTKAMNFLQKQHHVEIQLDAAALRDAGIDPTTTLVTFPVEGISLRAALDRMLASFDLTWLIKDEVLLITTKDKANSTLVTGIYPVGDLVPREDSDESGENPNDGARLLADDLTNTMAPQTWNNQGGPGSLQPYGDKISVMLVISQTQKVHDQIADLLAQLREVHRKQQEGSAGQQAKPAEPEVLEVRVYDLRVAAPNAPAMTPQEVAEVVKSLVEPKSWTQPDVYIRGVTGKLIVRQLPSVHREVRKLLTNLDATVKLGGQSGKGPQAGGGFSVPDTISAGK